MKKLSDNEYYDWTKGISIDDKIHSWGKKNLLFLHFYHSGGSLNIVMHSLTYGGVHVRSNACLDIKSHRDHIA